MAGYRRLVAGLQRDRPGAGTHLHAQAAVVLQPHRQRAVQRLGDEAHRQRLAQQHLARLARHLQRHPRGQQRRHLVDQPPVHVQFQAIGFHHFTARRRRRRAGREEQRSALVARGHRHLARAQPQRHDPRLGRHRQRLGQALPDKAARQLMTAGAQAHARRPLLLVTRAQHRQPLAAGTHVERPAITVTRQRHHRLGQHLPALGEAATGGPQFQPQGPGPGAQRVVAVIVGQHRTALRLGSFQHPGDPGLQRRRHVARGQRLRLGRAKGRQQDRRDEDRPPHCSLR